MSIYPHGELTAVPNRPGIRARSLVGPAHGITAFFIQEHLLEQGATIPLHTHPIEEVVIVAEGGLTVETETETQVVEGGNTLVIPPGTPHRLSNQHADPVRMLAAAAWNLASFYREGSNYLEGGPRE